MAVIGADIFIKQLGDLPAQARNIVRAELYRGGLAIKAEAQRLMAQNHSGKVYRRSGVEHVSSAPGEAPAIDTGFLNAGLIVKSEQDGDLVSVEANADYAAGLEFGTSKIAERPFMRPALASKRAEIIDNVEKAVKVGL